jgi:hypothetical protein
MIASQLRDVEDYGFIFPENIFQTESGKHKKARKISRLKNIFNNNYNHILTTAITLSGLVLGAPVFSMEIAKA